MDEINPRIVDGELVCSWTDCPSWGDAGRSVGCKLCGILGSYITNGDPCIPGLRRQRDEARREVCETLAREHNYAMTAARDMEPSDYAASHGWAYLYLEK